MVELQLVLMKFLTLKFLSKLYLKINKKFVPAFRRAKFEEFINHIIGNKRVINGGAEVNSVEVSFDFYSKIVNKPLFRNL